MRVLSRTEATVDRILALRVRQGLITQEAANRLSSEGIRIAATLVGKLRRHKFTDDQITQFVQRKTKDAQLVHSLTTTPEQRNRAGRAVLMARLVEAAWQGMQQDAAAYRTHS